MNFACHNQAPDKVDPCISLKNSKNQGFYQALYTLPEKVPCFLASTCWYCISSIGHCIVHLFYLILTDAINDDNDDDESENNSEH
jgi:hypothetical protein